MIAALARLQRNHGQTALPQQVQAFGISGDTRSKLSDLFRTHPPLEQRIAVLQQG